MSRHCKPLLMSLATLVAVVPWIEAVAAQPVGNPAEPGGASAEAVKVTPLGSGAYMTSVPGVPALTAFVIIEEVGEGTEITVFGIESGEILVIEAAPDEGRIYRNGDLAASWMTDDEGRAQLRGAANLRDSAALAALAYTLDDASVREEAALFPIVIPLFVTNWVFCIVECQCCESHYRNGGSTQNEPTCCSFCFDDSYCGTWPFSNY